MIVTTSQVIAARFEPFGFNICATGMAVRLA